MPNTTNNKSGNKMNKQQMRSKIASLEKQLENKDDKTVTLNEIKATISSAMLPQPPSENEVNKPSDESRKQSHSEKVTAAVLTIQSILKKPRA